MKTIFFVILLLTLFSCGTKENPYEAFEQVREAKKMGKDIIPMTDSAATSVVKKPLNEWQLYKEETLGKIKEAEIRIKELKQRKVSEKYQDKFNKQVEKLEKKNAELREQIEDYQKEQEARWKAFKLDMERQSDEIKSETKFLKQSDGNPNNYLETLFK